MRLSRIIILLAGMLLIVASRLPWMSVPVLFGVEGPSVEAIEIGWEDNGFVTAAIGFLLLVGAVLLKDSATARHYLPAASLAALAVAVVAGCFQRVIEIAPAAGFFAATDIGIYLTLAGGMLGLVGALGAICSRRSANIPMGTSSFG
jgi:hypothetical protein